MQHNFTSLFAAILAVGFLTQAAQADHSAPEMHQFFGTATTSVPGGAAPTDAERTTTPTVDAMAGDVIYLPIYFRALNGDVNASVAGFGYEIYASGDTDAVTWTAALGNFCYANPTQSLAPAAGDRMPHANNGPGILLQSVHGAVRGAGDAELTAGNTPCYLGYVAVTVSGSPGDEVKLWFSVSPNATFRYALSNAATGSHNTVAFGWDAARNAPDSYRFMNGNFDVLGNTSSQNVSSLPDAIIRVVDAEGSSGSGGSEDEPDVVVNSESASQVTQAENTTTVIVTDADSAVQNVEIVGAPADGTITIDADPGMLGGTITNDLDRRIVAASVTGLVGGTLRIDNSDAERLVVGVTEADQRAFDVVLSSPITGLALKLDRSQAGTLIVTLCDESDEMIARTKTPVPADGTTLEITLTFPGGTDSRTADGIAGLIDGRSYGPHITIGGTAIPSATAFTLSLSIRDDDVSGGELELRVVQKSDGTFVAAGSTDRGPADPTGTIGDRGVNSVSNFAWAELDQPGTFTIGRTTTATTMSVTTAPCGLGGGSAALFTLTTLMLRRSRSRRRHRRLR